MIYIVNKDDLPQSKISHRFEGYRYGDVDVSVFLVDSPPGGGAVLHTHPYQEVFITLEGNATFTVGDDTIEVSAGQIVVAPAGVPHKFVNSGNGPLKQVDIHPSGRIQQVNIPEDSWPPDYAAQAQDQVVEGQLQESHGGWGAGGAGRSKPGGANTLAPGRSPERVRPILRSGAQISGRKSMADVTYVSRVRVEPVEGRVRRAYIPGREEPVLFGVHSEVAEHYGVSPDVEEPHSSTLDFLVAAAGGWLLGTFRGALVARQISYDDLSAETVGEIETEDKVLVLKRIKQHFHLTAGEEDKATIERVLKVYVDSCPVARSIKNSIEISSELDFTAS